MIQNIIVFAALAAAFFYMGRRMYRSFKSKGAGGCGCGCGGGCGCNCGKSSGGSPILTKQK